MKKGKPQVSRIGSGFSFGKKAPSFEEMYEGYPSFDSPWDETQEDGMSVEKHIEQVLEHTLTILKHADRHPPKVDSAYGRSEYLCLVFESRAQIQAFAQEVDLFRQGMTDIPAEDFAAAVGIDLATGKLTGQKRQEGVAFGKMASNLGGNFNFGKSALQINTGKKKPEISEKLQSIRQNEKKLADYMTWVANGGYFMCLCFKDKKDKDALLQALGLEAEWGGRYLWCHDLAKALGMNLLPCEYKNKPVYSGR